LRVAAGKFARIANRRRNRPECHAKPVIDQGPFLDYAGEVKLQFDHQALLEVPHLALGAGGPFHLHLSLVDTHGPAIPKPVKPAFQHTPRIFDLEVTGL
jgi:hypothetical protein